MGTDELKSLFSKVFRKPYLWAVNSYKRSLFVLFAFIVVGIPIIEYLQNVVRQFAYIHAAIYLQNILVAQNAGFYVIAILFIITFSLLIYLLKKQVGMRMIRDRFDKGLNFWAIPLNSGWTVRNDPGSLDKMLAITNSAYPGTLKDTYFWYDYEVTFSAKIDSSTSESIQNFTFVIRSEDNYNGVMFQVTKTHLNPHLLYNSTYIKDVPKQLPTVLKSGEWIDVRVLVSGDNVEIFLDEFKTDYKIPSVVLDYVRTDYLRDTQEMGKLKRMNDEVTEKYNRIWNILKMDPGDAKEEAKKTIPDIFDEINKDENGNNISYSKIVLEYQKGSVGFRESGSEMAYFKNFKIKKL